VGILCAIDIHSVMDISVMIALMNSAKKGENVIISVFMETSPVPQSKNLSYYSGTMNSQSKFKMNNTDITKTDWKPDYSVTPRRIVCAAMLKNGRIITSARHYDKIMRAQMEASEGLDWWKGCKQGFIDQFGDFLDRKDAWNIAIEQNQIRQEVSSPGTLFSENLY
jgi:hypothetical protein